MRPFTYLRAKSPAEAAALAAQVDGSRFIAGGTNLLDLMKLDIETPTQLIDVNDLALDRIEATPEGGLRIGALVQEHRPRRRRAHPQGLRGALPRPPRRRLRPVAQHGHDRRQPAATHPLPVLL